MIAVWHGRTKLKTPVTMWWTAAIQATRNVNTDPTFYAVKKIEFLLDITRK